MTDPVETAIMQMIEAEEGRSVAPETVARAVGGEDWRRSLAHVRAVSKSLARQGRLSILRHGKPVEPEDLKGVYRLGPAGDD